MGLEFIDRSLRATGIVLLIFLPFGIYYLGIYPTLAGFSGGVWGMINLIFISAMVRATARPEGADKMRALGLAIFKFPLLYLSGYCLLVIPQFDPLYLVCGFSSLFLIIVLRAIGMIMVGTTDQASHEEKVQGTP